ncbi:hypothetical protein SUGI_0499520 [Cryptomeria japonica]|nr:hypothetical protein SUGI_0499520 [Cryptomeria japonica]
MRTRASPSPPNTLRAARTTILVDPAFIFGVEGSFQVIAAKSRVFWEKNSINIGFMKNGEAEVYKLRETATFVSPTITFNALVSQVTKEKYIGSDKQMILKSEAKLAKKSEVVEPTLILQPRLRGGEFFHAKSKGKAQE